jgi:hypothetical protein
MTPLIIGSITSAIVTIVAAITQSLVALRAHGTANTAITANANAVAAPMVATVNPKVSEVKE